jgi:two-component system, NarL family, response regulator NreC
MNTIRVLVVDGHPVARAGLNAILTAGSGMIVVGEAAGGFAALRLADELDPDVTVVEVALSDLDGAEVTARLCAGRPDRKVLALTACEDGAALRRMLTAGAVGYALKRSGTDELVEAVRAVAGGAIYLDPGVATRAADEPAGPTDDDLSAREREVVRRVAMGYANKEIAARLQLSVKTIETYKARALEKLDLRSRVALVRYAVKRGWLTG